MTKLGAGEFVLGDVERKNGDGEVNEGVIGPFTLPVFGEGGDGFWDVKTAVGCETGEDCLLYKSSFRASITMFEGK